MQAQAPPPTWSSADFINELRAVGRQAYHDKHPFHQKMNQGALSRQAMRLWAANRFYYQKNLPVKDASLLARCPVREVRRHWLQRILDHDGTVNEPGGIDHWLRLGEAVGLSRDDLEADRFLIPGVRYAVDAYIHFVQTRPWTEGVASSLTELFAPPLLDERLAALVRHYPWIDPEGLSYFRARLGQAPRDAEQGLQIVLAHCRRRTTGSGGGGCPLQMRPAMGPA